MIQLKKIQPFTQPEGTLRGSKHHSTGPNLNHPALFSILTPYLSRDLLVLFDVLRSGLPLIFRFFY